jgi:uncharacterized protein DUF1963
MFTSHEDARAFLIARGLAEHADRLLGCLLPCLAVMPAPTDRLGGTRMGGVPDLPPGLEWPVRPVPPDADAFAARWGTHRDWIARHITRALPYEFVAMIDLAEASWLPEGAGLPAEGRLLFFYDGAVGPWWDGPEAGRVIWDRTSAGSLAATPIPAALAELHAAERAEHDAVQADPMQLAKAMSDAQLKIVARTLKQGETLADYFGQVAKNMEFAGRYLHTGRPMRVVPVLQWPDGGSPEAAASAELQALADEGAVEYLSELSRGGLPGRPVRHILLGIPVAEQDDPRYEAAFRADPMLQRRLQADRKTVWPEVERRAGEWTLLLQVDQADLVQARFVEGTIYYMIRKSDLLAREFSRVEVIYQQT